MLTTRPIQVQDIPEVCELAARIWRGCYPEIISTAQIEYMLARMFSPPTIRAELEQGVVWELVVSEGRKAGFLSFRLESDGTRVKLQKLYLLPEFCGRGFGGQILEHVKGQAKVLKARTVFLTVNKRNARAIRAYERSGFRKVESVVCDIGGGFAMDDYIMSIDL